MPNVLGQEMTGVKATNGDCGEIEARCSMDGSEIGLTADGVGSIYFKPKDAPVIMAALSKMVGDSAIIQLQRSQK